MCIAARTLHYPNGGGHFWAYLNWALGLRALGYDVIWLETAPPDWGRDLVDARVGCALQHLAPYGFQHSVSVFCATDASWSYTPPGCLAFEAAVEADLLLNFVYETAPDIVSRFRRSALVDIDPGLLQLWMSEGRLQPAPHDVYFSVGETVGGSGALFPDGGLNWHYTPRPTYLPAWPAAQSGPDAAYTTVSDWWGEWIYIHGDLVDNGKRTTFLDYINLPSRTSVHLELALTLGRNDEEERRLLERRGWSVCHAWDVTPTPQAYRSYLASSRGEFSCAKPSCMLLENAWISDRTLCYLASGKPAVVQHTGPSAFLPEAEGLFRFRTPGEAASALAAVEADYERHALLARALVEEYFDAEKSITGVLEVALA